MPNFGIESHKLRQRVWQQKAKQDSHQIVSCTNRIQEATGQEELAESTSLLPRLVPLAQACRAGQLRAAPPTCTAGRHALPPTSRGPGRWRCRRPPRQPRGEARTLGLTWPPGAATESLASPLFSYRSKVSIVFGNKRFHSGYTIVFSSGFHLQNIGILHR